MEAILSVAMRVASTFNSPATLRGRLSPKREACSVYTARQLADEVRCFGPRPRRSQQDLGGHQLNARRPRCLPSPAMVMPTVNDDDLAVEEGISKSTVVGST